MKKSIVFSFIAVALIFLCTNVSYALDVWSEIKGNILYKGENGAFYLYEDYRMLETDIDEHYGPFDYAGRYTKGKEDYPVYVYYKWLQKLTPLLEQIANSDIDDICNDSGGEGVDNARDTIISLKRQILSFEYGYNNDVSKAKETLFVIGSGIADDDTQRSKEAFKKITGYSDTATYIQEKMYPAIRKLNAARDKQREVRASESIYSSIDGEKVCINDEYQTKFRYTYNQIEAYREAYGDEINISSPSERGRIRDVWNIKTGLKAKIDNGDVDSKQYENVLNHLLVDKDDDYAVKMMYNKDEIWLYRQLYGTDSYNVDNEKQEKTLVTEWNYVLEHDGNHTDFYNNNKTHDQYEQFNGNINEDITDEKENSARDKINSIKGNYNQIGRNYYDEHKNDLSSEDAQNYENEKNNADETSGEYHHPTKIGNDSTETIDKAMQNADDFIDVESNDKIEATNLQDLSNTIYSIALIAGIVIAVLVGAILGIKFMAGSIEEKADVKKLLIPYVVGCVVVFGAFGIWKLVITILSGI